MRKLESLLLACCRLMIGGIFWLVSRFFYSVEFHELEHDTGAPQTYLAISHKRDVDPIVTLPTILTHRGWRAWAGNVHFALRDDAFSPGYLALLLKNISWLSHLLHPLSIGPILRWLGAHPLEHLHMRPSEEWIRESLQIEGDTSARDILTPLFIENLAKTNGEDVKQIEENKLSHLLSWRYHTVLQTYCGPEIFVGHARRRIEQRVVQTLKEHINELSAWLSNGGSVYGAPEGRLSPDGNLGSATAALHRLLRTAPANLQIVAIFLSYDFMTTKRPRVFVDIAPAIEHPSTLHPYELDAVLRRAWLQVARFTCTQLASGFLMQASHTGTSFTLEDLTHSIKRQAKTLAQAGRHVDQRLLQFHKARKLAAHYLSYAERHALVRRTANQLWTPLPIIDTPIRLNLGEVGYDRMPLTYACNDLQELLSL